MRILIEAGQSVNEVLYKSSKFTNETLPMELKVLFQTVNGFYQYVYGIIAKKMIDRFVFKNGQLKIKVHIEGKMRSIPVKMKKMVEERDGQDGS